MNDDITVRAAGVADAQGIARVLVDGWKTTYAGILPGDVPPAVEIQRRLG
jgi:hypothetical protein